MTDLSVGATERDSGENSKINSHFSPVKEYYKNGIVIQAKLENAT